MANDDTSGGGRTARRRLLRTTAGLAVGGLLAGCAGSGDRSGTTATETETETEAGGAGTETEAAPTTATTADAEAPAVTFGTPKAAAAGVSPRVVRDQGYPDGQAFDLSLELGAPPALFTKLQGKALESSTFPVISGARLANQGGAIRLLQPVARSFNSIVVRADAGISDVTELQEVTLGSMPRKTAPFTHFALLLSLEGLSHEDYDFQFGPPPVLFGQMKNGDLDAMIGVEPFSTRLLSTGDYEEFFVFNERWKATQGADMPLVEAATYRSSIEEKPAAFRALTEGLREAGQYIAANPEAVFDRYADVLGLQTDEQARLARERIADIYPTEFSTELRESGKEVVRLAAEEGLLSAEPPVDDLFVDPGDL
jgi:ABC-type nitrate/sulfonate/bicarbonate transport system substrate-binding protein